jgi:hypothetical protein
VFVWMSGTHFELDTGGYLGAMSVQWITGRGALAQAY